MNPNDLKVELIYPETGTTKPPSPGGQHVGPQHFEVRITHIPSGIVSQCGACRSQHKNREVAMEMILGALTCKYADELK